jgi:hypothetical protein
MTDKNKCINYVNDEFQDHFLLQINRKDILSECQLFTLHRRMAVYSPSNECDKVDVDHAVCYQILRH